MAIYHATFNNVTVAAVQDLFSVQPAANRPVALHRVVLSSTGQTTAAELKLTFRRMTATFTVGSGGSAQTPTKSGTNEAAAAGATVRANDTVQATTSGSNLIFWADTFQVLNGYDYFPPPEHRVKFINTEGLVISLDTAPTSASYSGVIVFEEF